MIRTFFGSPGCGKTTLCVKFAKKFQSKYNFTITNFKQSVPGSGYYENLKDLGKWRPPRRSWCGWDESGIDFNNRAHKSMSQQCISLHKKHRHLKLDIDCFSQSWDDIDITLRRLSVELWYMKRLGPWTLCRKVYKRVTVDKNTEQIIDGYRMANMLWIFFPWIWVIGLTDQKFMLTFRPFYYKYFDSYDFDESIPVKMPVLNADRAGPVPLDGTGAADQQDHPADEPSDPDSGTT